MTIYDQQSKNVRKTWLLMAGFLAVVILIAWLFSRIYDNPTILYFGVIFSLIMNFVSYWFSDKIALASVRARRVEKESDAPEIWDVVENLSITAGIPMPRLYVIDDPAPNAFATGRNKENAAVAVTSGLIQRLNRTELEGVIAHELSHIKNRDILLQTVVVVLVGFIALISDWFLRSRIYGFGGDRDNDRASGVLAVVGIVLAILSPIIATIIQLAISRKREYLADASGALLTRYPEGLASALEKISAYSRPMAAANNATAHMFISNPFGSQATRSLHKLFMTHPPAEDRIRILRSM